MGWWHRGHGRLSAGMPSRNCFVLLALLPCALALVSGCKEDQPPASLTQPERPFLYEADFARTPTLAARQDQVVVVDLEPTGGAQATAEDLARYELEAGMYRFCIEKDDPYLEHLRLENGDGQAAVDLDASAECVDVHLDAGTYRLRLRHRGADISGAHRVAFVHRLSPRPTLLGDGGVPRTGWWALAPNDPTGKLRPGRLHAQPPPRPVGTNKNFYQAAEPIVADFSSQQIDQSALFSFRNLGGSFADDGPLVRSGMYPLDVTIFSQMEASSTFIADTKQTRVGFKFTEFALQIVELGNQKVQLQEKPTFYPYTNFFIDVDNVIKWDNKSPNLPDLTAQVLFRTSFVGDPDYAQNVPGEGEIAVYENCNYTGQVTIFALDTPDLSALSGPGFALYGAIASVRSGHNTVAVLHSEANFGGTTVTVAESPCLDGTPVGRNTRSLQPSPALPIFIASSSCENCDLSGLDLTGVSVSGADLRGANLSGATLNRTILREARSLVGTSFDGAAITCSDFSGTEQALVDLTQTDLFTTTFSPDISSCRSNFSNTKVNVASLNPAALRLLDLTACDDHPVSHSTGGRPEWGLLEQGDRDRWWVPAGHPSRERFAGRGEPAGHRHARGRPLGSDTEWRGSHRKPHRRQQSRGRALSGRDAARCDRVQHRRLGRSGLHRSPSRRGRVRPGHPRGGHPGRGDLPARD